jgi:hypothetical protein
MFETANLRKKKEFQKLNEKSIRFSDPNNKEHQNNVRSAKTSIMHQQKRSNFCQSKFPCSEQKRVIVS